MQGGPGQPGPPFPLWGGSPGTKLARINTEDACDENNTQEIADPDGRGMHGDVDRLQYRQGLRQGCEEGRRTDGRKGGLILACNLINSHFLASLKIQK